jgi:hypothetical protein
MVLPSCDGRVLVTVVIGQSVTGVFLVIALARGRPSPIVKSFSRSTLYSNKGQTIALMKINRRIMVWTAVVVVDFGKLRLFRKVDADAMI